MPDANTGGIISLLFIGFIGVAGIMAIFIPFWIFRIRNEIIETNRLLKTLVAQGGGDPIVMLPKQSRSGKPMKYCQTCGQGNAIEDTDCIKCGSPLQ